jgi:hypothetical protein
MPHLQFFRFGLKGSISLYLISINDKKVSVKSLYILSRKTNNDKCNTPQEKNIRNKKQLLDLKPTQSRRINKKMF